MSNIKSRLKKIILLSISLFIILFIFRLLYGYSINPNEIVYEPGFFESLSNIKKNYASKEYKGRSGATVTVDQKYEKVAEINTKSTQFDKEENQVRKQIEHYKALIQFEQKSGNNGARKLNLLVGVPPDNFDSLYNKLITIGKVQSKQITKKDKTNEYKELNAKKASLEKIRASLLDLKAKEGKIEEYMGLENRILEIEQELQTLGVSLGDFDDENEFCTVQFSLLEGKISEISFFHRLKVALEWTVKIYLKIMASLFFLTLFAYLLLLIIEKLKIFEKFIKNQPQ